MPADCLARCDGGNSWVPVGTLVGLEPLPSNFAYRLPRNVPVFLVVYGWIFIALYSINIILSLFQIEEGGPLPLLGAILGLIIGIGLVRGSGKAVLGLTVLVGFGLIGVIAIWPSKTGEVTRIMEIPIHYFLLLSISVLFIPPMIFGIIKRKGLT
jgi:hypothetical protein